MRASPVGQPPSLRHSAKSSGPAARWIAPSTPPPPKREVFAALTIASTASVVMSVWRAVMRSPGTGTAGRLLRGGAGAAHAERKEIGLEQRFLLVELVLIHFPDLDDLAHDLYFEAVRLGLGIDVANIVAQRLLLFFQALDALDEGFEMIAGDAARLRHDMSPASSENEATLSKRQRRRNARAGVIHVILLSTASVLVIDRLGRLVLVFLLPFVIRHAVDGLARFRIGQLEAALLRRFAIPAR